MARHVDVEWVDVPQPTPSEQQSKNEAARQLLRTWLADESGYDEAVWPVAKRVIEANRLSVRPRFND
jgi:hypothetical protein